MQARRMQRRPGVALYAALRDELRRLIESEDLAPGDLLPSEPELVSRYGVSRATVRAALAELEREGLVTRQQGKGTYVSLPPMPRSLPELTSFSEHLAARGMVPSGRLLDYRTGSAGDWPDSGHHEAGTRLVRVVRLRLADRRPVGLHTVYLPADIARRIGFTEDALRADPGLSLYRLLEEAGLAVAWAEEHLQARAAGPAEARHLGVRAGTPVMSVLRLTRDAADRLIEVVRAVYLGHRYDYVVQLQRQLGSPTQGGAILAEDHASSTGGNS
ncbi:MAG TPA: GntR family transcriptional regulator [Candidatus Dormibacteraeota bacterium]|nr:GntR family transcriptional regulator [Candidatus Dormibacteraeota bacterium]